MLNNFSLIPVFDILPKYEFPHQGIQEGIGSIQEELSSMAPIAINLHSFSDNKRIVIEEVEINDLIRKKMVQSIVLTVFFI